MNKFKIILAILSDRKWDYAKLAQITSILGGTKQALLKVAGFSAIGGILLWETAKKSFGVLKDKIKKQPKKKQNEINKCTEKYLSEREELIKSGEKTDLIDKEYNEYMETTLGALSEIEKDDVDSSKITKDSDIKTTDKDENDK